MTVVKPLNIFRRLLDSGLNEQNTTGFNGRIRIQNAFALSSSLLAIPFIVGMLFLGFPEIALIFVLIQIGLLISLALNRVGDYRSSKFLVLFLISAALPVFSLFLGYNSGFYLYFFLTPLITLSIFNFSETRKIIISGLIFTTCFLLTEFLHFDNFSPLTEISDGAQGILFQVNLFVGIFILSFLTFFVINFYNKLTEEVKEMNEGLELIKREQEQVIEEKNVLLAEVHHRVKNNLAIISSLFNLQLDKIHNKEARDIIKNNASRIKSMSLVHDSLYKLNNVSRIEMGNYIQKLCENLKVAYLSDDQKVNVIYDFDEVYFDLEKAIPCGMLVNEILLNICKHAFGNGESGEVYIGFKTNGTDCQLMISDNGEGFNPEHDVKPESIGLLLIESLVSQLDGKLEVSAKKGTCYQIGFPIQ